MGNPSKSPLIGCVLNWLGRKMLQILLITTGLTLAIALPVLLTWGVVGVVGRMMSVDSFDERERR